MIKIEFKDGKDPLEIDAVKNRLDLREADLRKADLRKADLNEADLFGANLRGANLREADLRKADLREADLNVADLFRANLRGADLRGADVDFSCWPLWCGSLNVKIDKRIFCQLLYHTLRAGKSVDDPEVNRLFEIPEIVNLANQFHRVDECGKIEAQNGKD